MDASLNSGKVVVHFGMPKTGSSSIQNSLFRNLADPRFHYVHLGRANPNLGIRTGFSANPMRFLVHAKRGTSPDALRHLKESTLESLDVELRAAGARTAILSSEVIPSLDEPEFRDLCAAVVRHGATLSAVGYVRRPKEFMESAFQQRVKTALRQLDTSRLFPDYAGLEKFDAVVGREHVRLWLFDPASFPGRCVVQDFCARLGIDFAPEGVLRLNEALSLPALSLLFAYRKFGPGYGDGSTAVRENRLLIRRIGRLPGPKLRLHSSLVAPVIEQNRRQIGWMEERLGASLAEDLAAHDETAIRREKDLLKFAPEALQWLARELGEAHVKRWHPGMSPREVAEWMHQLRLKLASARKATPEAAVGRAGGAGVSITHAVQGDATMNIEELVRSAATAAKLGAVKHEDAQSLVREVFRHISREIDATSEGKVSVEGLGLFRIRQGEREKDGQKIPVKRIAFQARKTENEAQ